MFRVFRRVGTRLWYCYHNHDRWCVCAPSPAFLSIPNYPYFPTFPDKIIDIMIVFAVVTFVAVATAIVTAIIIATLDVVVTIVVAVITILVVVIAIAIVTIITAAVVTILFVINTIAVVIVTILVVVVVVTALVVVATIVVVVVATTLVVVVTIVVAIVTIITAAFVTTLVVVASPPSPQHFTPSSLTPYLAFRSPVRKGVEVKLMANSFQSCWANGQGLHCVPISDVGETLEGRTH